MTDTGASQSDLPSIGAIDDRLSELKISLQQLPPLRQEQTTILSLARMDTDENTWKRILRYLLDPEESHGLDDIVLQQFFSVLIEEDIVDDLPRWRDENLRVEDEISMGGGSIDLVIRVPGQWFVAIEMKVLSPEDDGQTEKYAQSETIGEERVENYPPAKRTYVYLSEKFDAPNSAEFDSLSWETIARSFRNVMVSGTGQQSVRGQTQLRTFTNTVIEQFSISMNPATDDNAIDERMALYNEYRDDIEELEQAFDEFTEKIAKQWERRFTQDYESVSWSDTWYTRGKGSRQLQFYRDEWVFQSKNPESLSNSPLLHLEAQISPSDLRDGFFTFHISVGGAASRNLPSEAVPGDGTDWKDYIDDMCNKSTKFDEALPQRVNLSGNRQIITEAKYGGIRNESDFYRHLEKAFEDHLPVADVLTQLVQQNIDPAVEKH